MSPEYSKTTKSLDEIKEQIKNKMEELDKYQKEDMFLELIVDTVYNIEDSWIELHQNHNANGWIFPQSTSLGKKLVRCFVLASWISQKIFTKKKLLELKKEHDKGSRVTKKWTSFVDVILKQYPQSKLDTTSFKTLKN